MLDISHLEAGYGPLQVIWDVSLSVAEGEFVALIGPNGAGKTTVLRAVAGLVKPLAGQVDFLGKTISGRPAHQASRLGISFVTEELNLFPQMTVRENLLLGAYTRRGGQPVRRSMDEVSALFPVLGQRKNQLAGTLSGGERRMLALGRGLMAAPRLLIVDEPSLGLAPITAQEVLAALCALHRQGVTILLVEQNVHKTLDITDRSYVLERGRVVLEGRSSALLENAYLKQAYLGLGEAVEGA